MDTSPGSGAPVAELVVRARSGERAAWVALVDRYTDLLWYIARTMRLSTADAGDVVQTTWLRLVEHLDRVDDPDRVGAWLATTARNECLLIIRQRARTQVGLGADVADQLADGAAGTPPAGARLAGASAAAPPEPEADLLRRERHREVRQAFTRLGARCRALLALLVTDPRPSYEEVSAALAMPPGSIGPTRARCLRELRRLLAGPVGAASSGDGPSAAEAAR
jgi:RNA polymerase sigma factor (sigma-70 family)